MDSMYRIINKKLTQEDMSCFDNMDRAIWDLVENDMAGYIHMATAHLVARLLHDRREAEKEINKLTI